MSVTFCQLLQEDENNETETGDNKPWGFCSHSCTSLELTPSVYHEQANVDILPSSRCKQ